MGRLIDLTGQTFGWLRVESHVGFNENRQSLYRVVCLCGEIKTVRGSDLTEGKTRTCGPNCKHKHETKPCATVRVTVIRQGGEQTRFAK